MNQIVKARWDRAKAVLVWALTHYTLGFVIVLSISVASCFLSVLYLSGLDREITRTFEYEIKGQDYSQRAYTLMLALENETKDLVVFSDYARRAEARGAIDRDLSQLRRAMDDADSRFYTKAGREILGRTRKSMAAFVARVAAVADRLLDNPARGDVDLRELQAARLALAGDLQRLIDNKTANSNVGYSALIGQLRLSLLVTIAILLVTIAVRVAMYLSGRPARRPS